MRAPYIAIPITKCKVDKCTTTGKFASGYCYPHYRQRRFFSGLPLGNDHNKRKYSNRFEKEMMHHNQCNYPNCKGVYNKNSNTPFCIAHRENTVIIDN